MAQCDLCGAKIVYPHLKRHRDGHKVQEKSSPREEKPAKVPSKIKLSLYRCNLCNKVFGKKRCLRMHKEEAHPIHKSAIGTQHDLVSSTGLKYSVVGEIPAIFVSKKDIEDWDLLYERILYGGLFGLAGAVKLVLKGAEFKSLEEKNYKLDRVVEQKFEKLNVSGIYLMDSTDCKDRVEQAVYKKMGGKALEEMGHKDEQNWTEKAFWELMEKQQCNFYYAADTSGSLTSPEQKGLNQADKTMGKNIKFFKKDLDGITNPFLYMGMFGATFPWHVEDLNLPSINILHHGATKLWYILPPEKYCLFLKEIKGVLESMVIEDPTRQREEACPGFLNHKRVVASPEALEKLNPNLRPFRVYQNPGEAIVTSPKCLHSGINLGINYAEASNTIVDSWIVENLGLQSTPCQCKSRQMTMWDIGPVLKGKFGQTVQEYCKNQGYRVPKK